MSWVWEHSPQKEGSLLVLLALADFAHDDGGGAYPSVKTLAAKARMKERNVQYCLRRLEAAGEIAKEGFHTSGATIWRVVLPVEGGANIAPANIAPGATHCTGGVQPIAPKPSIEPSNTPYGVFAAVCEEAGLDASAFRRSDVNAQCKVAQRLLGDGLTLDEARTITRYLRGQSWRTEPVTIWTVHKELGKWRAAGRPEQEKARRPRTQADINAGGKGMVW